MDLNELKSRDIPPEIVLVVPFWSYKQAMNFDSCYVVIRNLLPILKELLPNYLWIILWPTHKEFRYKDDKLFELPSIYKMPMPFETSVAANILPEYRYIVKVMRDIAPTVIWNHFPEWTIFWQRGITATQTPGSLPAIVSQYHFIIHESFGFIDEQRRLLQLTSLIASDANIFNSEYCFKMTKDVMEQYLSGQQQELIKKKSYLLPFGFVQQPPELRPYHKPVIIYNHRFLKYKQPEVTAKILRELLKKHDFEIWITQFAQKLSDFPYHRIVGHPLYSEYLKNIAVPAVNTINSIHETFCIAIMDSISLGHLVVVPKGLTFPELLPEDYPYLFTSVKEQKEMLEYILTHWEQEQKKWSPKLRKYAIEKFSLLKCGQRYASCLSEQAQQKREFQLKPSNQRKVNEIKAELKGTYSVPDLVNLVYTKTKGHLGQLCRPPSRVVRILTDKNTQLRFNVTTQTVEVTFR